MPVKTVASGDASVSAVLAMYTPSAPLMRSKSLRAPARIARRLRAHGRSKHTIACYTISAIGAIGAIGAVSAVSAISACYAHASESE